MSEGQHIAEENTILRTLVGSSVHGLGVGDQDDRDEMGICVEPWEHFFGCRPRFDQFTWRTKPEGVRSGPGDLDLVIYSLVKWARLAVNGNPTVLLPLFAPESAIITASSEGRALIAMRAAFIGNNVFGPYLGYMRQQRKRLDNGHRMPRRPELVAKYGYDTKYAGHLLRLGYQGLELASTGALTLPMREPQRTRILDVRTGRVPQSEVLEEAAELERQLESMEVSSSLAPPDVAAVERFVIDCYMRRHPPFV